MAQHSAVPVWEGHTHAQLRNAEADICTPVVMDITFEEADQFSLVDLQSQLAASGWPYHVQSVVTAPPKAATNLTFHREVWGGKSMIIVTWAPPAAGHRNRPDLSRVLHQRRV